MVRTLNGGGQARSLVIRTPCPPYLTHWKSDAGRTLSAASFTGATRLVAGELRVNSSLARSTVTAGTGTTLSGTGTLGGLVAQSGSTVAPGSDGIGTLGVTGNIQLLAGSTYAAQIQPTAADVLFATGTAQLGGTLAIQVASGSYLFGSSYAVLQANGGRTGAFKLVTGLNSFGQAFAAQVVYTATGVQVLLTPNQLLTIVGMPAVRGCRLPGSIHV